MFMWKGVGIFVPRFLEHVHIATTWCLFWFFLVYNLPQCIIYSSVEYVYVSDKPKPNQETRSNLWGCGSKFPRSVGTWTTLAVLLVAWKQLRSFLEVVILLKNSEVSSMGVVKMGLQQTRYLLRNSWRRCSCPSPTPSCSCTTTPLLMMSPVFKFGTLPNMRILKRAIARISTLKHEEGVTREGN